MAETRLKNGSDWRSWTAFRDGSEAASAGVNRSKKGTVEQARRLVIRAYHRRAWGLPGGKYRLAAARLTAAGYPTKEKDFKNAARGALIENTIPEMAVREFIAAICAIWPAFEWQRLVTPQEPASEPGKSRQNLRRNIKTAQISSLQPIDPVESLILRYGIPHAAK